METSLIKLYCKIDDMLKKIGKKDDIQAKMSSSEIVFVAIVSAKYYGCNFENTRHSIESRRLVNHMLSKSQFNRRLHALGPKLWEAIIRNLGDIALAQATNKAFVIDSFPIPVCVNWRIGRCSIYEEEVYRG